ncbi:PilZ domain-containing protein [Treponema sp. TIM-1]|uniref:pilus assembly protein PilZ n=1 Tax=Treponema sp. TIM-1 TaxID=2898417 RepID=UPI003980EB5B
MADDNNSTDITGKKIFFLHPTALVQNEIAAALIQRELEVYIVRDHLKLRRVLKKYPTSIVFANIDNGMPEKDWETWIRGILSDPPTATIAFGIFASENNGALAHKYVDIIKVKCGYTVIRPDTKKSIIQILENLKAVDAWGRRKYIRVTSDNEALTTINLPYNNDFIKGTIKDISVAGLSCFFPLDPNIEKNSLISNIQIKLQSILLKAEGIVFGSRMDGLIKIYVIMFTQRTDPEVRVKIRKFIQSTLQSRMDTDLR